MLSEKGLELPSLAQARKEIKELLDRYHKFKDDKGFSGNEKQACTSLIVPLIHKVLHWETEEPSEFKTEESQSGKRIDYCVYNQGISQFIVEAKAPKYDIFDNDVYYKQALEYGYGKEHDFAILTNFRQVVILGCQIKFRVVGETEIARFDLLQATDEELKLLLNFEKNYWVNAGKEKILYSFLSKHKKTIPLDEQLLEDMKRWREQLLRSIKQKSSELDFEEEEEFNYIEEEVQKIIDRLIFICYCEDKELNEPQLKRLMLDKNERFSLKTSWLLGKIQEVFAEYRRIYDSDLFDKSKCDEFKIDDVILLGILSDLREPKGRLTYDFKSIEADILGKTYENFIGHIQSGKKRFTEKEDIGKRKKEGIYYTPKYIVDYIVNNTVREFIKGKSFVEINKIRILDPACGSGSFLLRAYGVLIEESEISLKRELNYEEKASLLLNCIHGVDLDKRACDIAKLNLSLKMAEHGQKLPMLRDNIRVGNSLIDDKDIAGYKAFVWQEEFKEIMANGGFDVVVGNPPYGAVLDKTEKEFFYSKYDSCEYQLDTYSLFVERGLQVLKDSGLLGFIIPSTFLTMHFFKKFRKYLLDNASIKYIIKFEFPVFEEATVETTMLILQKKKNVDTSLSYATIKQKENFISSNFKINRIPQRNFYIDDYGFFINRSSETTKTLDKIKKSAVLLRACVKITIGIKPYQTGKGIPKQTKKTVEDRPFDSNYQKDKSYKQYVVGKDLNRYSIIPKDRWIKYGRWLAEPRPAAPFNRTKILIRQTADRIIASIDEEKLLTLNNVHNLEITCKEVGYKYLLAILNSKLFRFVYTCIVPEVGRVFAEVKVVNLEKLPIRIISEPQQQPLIKLVDRMLSLNKSLNETKNEEEKIKIKKEIQKTDNEIDELVYKLYGITEAEKKIIEESLK